MAFFPFQAMDQLKRLTGGEYLAFSNSVYVQTILHVHILMHLRTNATSDWITSNICGSTRRLYERVVSLWLTSGVTFFESAFKKRNTRRQLWCSIVQCSSSLKGEHVKKMKYNWAKQSCIKIICKEANRRYRYGRKLYFTSPLTHRH